MLEFAKTNAIVTVQRAFRTEFGIDPPHRASIRRWVRQFKVFVPPLPVNINDLKDRITAAINTVDGDILKRVWEEFSYWLDVVRAAGGGHIEHL